MTAIQTQNYRTYRSLGYTALVAYLAATKFAASNRPINDARRSVSK